METKQKPCPLPYLLPAVGIAVPFFVKTLKMDVKIFLAITLGVIGYSVGKAIACKNSEVKK